MLNKILGIFSHDIGIDLGTANTLVYVRGRGIVINEPSVVAINDKTNQILSIGDKARKMVGKTPGHIVASRPLVDGVVSDFEVTEAMLKYFIDRVHQETFSFMPRPRCVIGIPSGVTEVEKRAVLDAAKNAGAREVYLIEEPMAAAIGSRLPIQDPAGNVIVDIGGGTTEIAVISLGGIVVSKSLRLAGDKLNSDIMEYCKSRYNLLIGERTAEDVKIKIGAAFPLDKSLRYIGLCEPLKTPHHLKREPWRYVYVLEDLGDKLRVSDGKDEFIVKKGKGVRRGERILVIDVKRKITVDKHELDVYWGYDVFYFNRTLDVLLERLKERGFLIIGTSKYGEDVRKARISKRDKIAIIFGGPFRGIREILKKKWHTHKKYFDYFLNFIPRQNVETIRMEEAVHYVLAVLRYLSVV